jgi:hypothetical protein
MALQERISDETRRVIESSVYSQLLEIERRNNGRTLAIEFEYYLTVTMYGVEKLEFVRGPGARKGICIDKAILDTVVEQNEFGDDIDELLRFRLQGWDGTHIEVHCRHLCVLEEQRVIASCPAEARTSENGTAPE